MLEILKACVEAVLADPFKVGMGFCLVALVWATLDWLKIYKLLRK
jgi:hypothetical protein